MADSSEETPRDEERQASGRQLRLALAQLPARMRGALRLFRELTEFTAVTSLGAWDAARGAPGAIAPPVHPQCALQIRKAKAAPPCEEQWRWHVRTGRRTHGTQRHVCPLGLRCSCVPILYGETLVGTAKVVAGPETTDRRFSIAARALEFAVSQVCQDFHVAALEEEVKSLRREAAANRDLRERVRPRPTRPAAAPDGSLVDRTLRHLGAHYLDPSFSLAGVGRALGVNDKYLTRLFTSVVGERMHAYVLGLRVQHACRLLLSSDRSIKEVALASGFRTPERFRRVFLEHVGVSAATYRRLFRAS